MSTPVGDSLAQLRPGPVVLPALLLCDFGHLSREIEAVEAAGARALHLDVMDGHFVPNLTYGLTIVEAVRKSTRLPLDVHLMISNPHEHVERYVDAGADLVSFHIEATDEPEKIIERVHDRGAACGLALCPPTPLEQAIPYLDAIDYLLVMSVMPGYGGQKFEPSTPQKVRDVPRDPDSDLVIEVDGGIGDETIWACAEAGADWFVAGSVVFNSDNYAERIDRLTQLATRG